MNATTISPKYFSKNFHQQWFDVHCLNPPRLNYELVAKNHMNQMAISKQTWFLFYQPEIMYLTLLFLLIWFFIFQNTLKSWDQQIKALEDINQWKLWGGLIFGILFLLLAL